MNKPLLLTKEERAMATDERWFSILNQVVTDMREANCADDELVSKFSRAIFNYKKNLREKVRKYGYEELHEERQKIYTFQEQISLI